MSEEINIGQEKFDSCKYRSTTMEEVGEFSCCSADTLHMAWVCFRRDIEDLEPSYCENCTFYKEKIK